MVSMRGKGSEPNGTNLSQNRRKRGIHPLAKRRLERFDPVEQLRSGQQIEESADIGVGDMGKDALPLRGGLVRMLHARL